MNSIQPRWPATGQRVFAAGSIRRQRRRCPGAEPDLPGEVAWWQPDDFWQYAMFAAIAHIRIAAGRANVPVHQVCQELTQRPDPQPG